MRPKRHGKPPLPKHEGTGDLVDSGDLYRALQQHKTDDLDAIRRVVAEQEAAHIGADRPHVVDLCSGIGRTVHLYPSQKWQLTCVDSDAVALRAIARLRPDATIVHSRVEDYVNAEAAHLVVCAHHAANEVDNPLALVETSAQMVGAGGALYLDLMVGATHYPASHLREAVRELEIGGAAWLLQTVVLPDEHPRSHTLLLIAERTDGNDAIARRVVHRLRRRVPTEDEVLTQAAARGLTLRRSERSGRYVFQRHPAFPGVDNVSSMLRMAARVRLADDSADQTRDDDGGDRCSCQEDSQAAGHVARHRSRLADVSKGQLSKLEHGRAAFTKRGLVEDLALAIGCAVSDITGQPYLAPDPLSAEVAGMIPALSLAINDATLDWTTMRLIQRSRRSVGR